MRPSGPRKLGRKSAPGGTTCGAGRRGTNERVFLTQFEALGLPEPILRAVAAEGYSAPTPIQAAVIPAMMDGRDILGTAQTGTGKTAAFTLPILSALADERGRPQPKTARALVLAPTRELAAQIADAVKTYGRHLHISVALVVGGVKPGPQVRALARGVDVLVATPGRLEDHMGGGAVSLASTRIVVLDEADQMLDLGFMPAIRRILGRLPKERQTALLSATMPPPIRALASDFLRKPAEFAVSPASRPVEAIHQSVRQVDAADKRTVLLDLLADPQIERAIVFTRTKRGADRVSQHIAGAGHNAAAIHGNKSQGQRDRALGGFRDGSVKILVATDIAARGIDVDGVSHVFNFELPNVPEAYVHRIGRTARAGKSGIAVSLCAPDERPLLKDIETLIGRRLTADGTVIALAPSAPRTPAVEGVSPKRRRPRRRPGAGPSGPSADGRPVRPEASARRPSGPRGRAGATRSTAGHPTA